MARGQQKVQSQQKAQEKNAKAKKQQGHSLADQKAAAQKALNIQCVVCKSQMPGKFFLFYFLKEILIRINYFLLDPKTYKQHFENKHPKNDMPEDLKAL